MFEKLQNPFVLIPLFLLLLIGPAGARFLGYHQFSASLVTPPPVYNPIGIPEKVPTPGMNSYIDMPEQLGSGFVLLDQAHNNQFSIDELGYLDGRLAARGYNFKVHQSGSLANSLRTVSAFIVIAPTESFSAKEIVAVQQFVDRGGRLILIGDPTRFDLLINEEDYFFSVDLLKDQLPLNSLANQFDIIFNGDYLYNTVDNEGNFRNIFLRKAGFESENSLVDGLDKLVFYGAHSLHTGANSQALITTGEDSWSSATDRPSKLVVAAVANEGKVLALGDLHFLTEPYATVFDNGAFVARIADFLVQAQKEQSLTEFPYFFASEIDFVFLGEPELTADSFAPILLLQADLQQVQKRMHIRNTADEENDLMYAGVYNQAEPVADILAEAGVSFIIEPAILTKEEQKALAEEDVAEDEGKVEEVRQLLSPMGRVELAGSTLFLLQEDENGRSTMIVLAANGDSLTAAIGRLQQFMDEDASFAFADCLVEGNLAICPSGDSAEQLEAELSFHFVTDEIDSEIGEPLPEFLLEAEEQGSLEVDTPMMGTLDSGVSHSWVLDVEETAIIEIIVEGAEDIDAIVQLYDAHGDSFGYADDTFSGGIEQIGAVDLSQGIAPYRVVIEDFDQDGGSYTVSISYGELSTGGLIEQILIFADNDGTAATTGFTAVVEMEAILADSYSVSIWDSQLDGPLDNSLLSSFDLVIWESGDYGSSIADAELDEDALILFEYLLDGGRLFLTGATHPFFATDDVETGTLNDIEFVGDDSLLLAGLPSGPISLDQSYETTLSDQFEGDADTWETVFIVRGSGSEGSGQILGTALTDPETGLKLTILALPFSALPEDIQATLLRNIVSWLD